MNGTVKALLSGRREALGIREITFDVFVHPDRDPGCRLRAHEYLRSQASRYCYALVLLDRQGCGSGSGAPEIEAEICHCFAGAGWGNRAAAIVIDPELEVWVWSDSPHVDQELGWSGRLPGLKNWLTQQGHWPSDRAKPKDPKQAMEVALREARKPRSSAIYERLAATVSLQRCQDRSFLALKRLLAEWFPPSPR